MRTPAESHTVTAASRMGIALTGLSVLAALAAGCSTAAQVPSLEQAQELATTVEREIGVEPDSREALERTNGPIYTQASTVMLRWEDFPEREDPIEVLAAALRGAGLNVVYRADTYPEGRPNSGNRDIPELEACVPLANPPIGASISIGQVDDSTVAVAAQVGGTPAVACGSP